MATLVPIQANPVQAQVAPENNECSICFEPMTGPQWVPPNPNLPRAGGIDRGTADLLTLHCSHVFHKHCVARQIIANNQDCAMCRRVIPWEIRRHLGDLQLPERQDIPNVVPEAHRTNRVGSNFFQRATLFITQIFQPSTNSHSLTGWDFAITLVKRVAIVAIRIAVLACQLLSAVATYTFASLLLETVLPASLASVIALIPAVIVYRIFIRAFVNPGSVFNFPDWAARSW